MVQELGWKVVLGDPRSENMQKNLNLKVKFRESFDLCTFNSSEDLSDWFDISVESPYMLLVANIHNSKKIQMTNEQEKLFGIDKLNTRDLKFQQ